MVYSPNGRYIATTTVDDTLRVWDASTGQALQIDHDQSGVGNPAFSPDSRMVAESNDDNQIRVWTVCAYCQDPSALLRASDSQSLHRSPLSNAPKPSRRTVDGPAAGRGHAYSGPLRCLQVPTARASRGALEAIMGNSRTASTGSS